MIDKQVRDSVLNAISHLATALRMDEDDREKGMQYELKCAIDEIQEHCDNVQVEYE